MKKKNEVKKIPIKDYDAFVDIVTNAYPGFHQSRELDKQHLKKSILRLNRERTVHHYGSYKKNKLVGVMRLTDFRMNLFTNFIQVGGVGLIGVDLLHKKEKVCMEMVDFFLKYYSKKGACMTALYPFRPDFYKKMGFGYGTKVSEYSIKPADLPRRSSKKIHITFMKRSDKQSLNACYNRFFMYRHGMFERKLIEWSLLFDFPNIRVIGYKKSDRILGYIVFGFKKKEKNVLQNNLVIYEFVYENREVFSELLSFLNTQSDQIDRIIYGTQDDFFHFMPLDPRNGSNNMFRPLAHETNIQGVGIMYRVINILHIFDILKDHDFGGQTCRLKISVADNLLNQNKQNVCLQLEKGKAVSISSRKYDVEIRLDIADFSSLLMGVVDFSSLYNYGFAEISNTRFIDTIDRVFHSIKKPICMTVF